MITCDCWDTDHLCTALPTHLVSWKIKNYDYPYAVELCERHAILTARQRNGTISTLDTEQLTML